MQSEAPDAVFSIFFLATLEAIWVMIIVANYLLECRIKASRYNSPRKCMVVVEEDVVVLSSLSSFQFAHPRNSSNVRRHTFVVYHAALVL